MWRAAEEGDEAGLRALLASGAGEGVIEWTDLSGKTPLGAASQNGHLSCVELLLKAGAQVDSRDEFGLTPLNWASAMNYHSVVSALLAAGAQVDLANNNGWTPLMIAAFCGHSAVATLLLDAGGNRVLKNSYGKTALDSATQEYKAEVAEILREHERLELVVRPEVVARSALALPAELAELCGDFVFMTAARRALEERQRAAQ